MFSRCKLPAICLLSLFSVALSGCAALRPQPAIAISDDLDADSLRAAIRYSIDYLQKLPPEQLVGAQPRLFTAKEILDSLNAFQQLLEDWQCAECFAREVNDRFELVPSSSDVARSDVLFTGYYQVVMDGSLVPTERFRFPIYAQPPDLVSAEKVTLSPQVTEQKIFGRVEGEEFLPYYTRRQIDEDGVLRGRGLEIAWVADPIELFFLHIQGSGIIRLPDGRQLSIGYAAQNGWPYRSIGRLLIDTGKLTKEEMSMQRLRRYLRENPQEQSEILDYNQSYIFFQVNRSGAMGSLGVPVTAGRSVATDSRLFPKGALALVDTEIPMVDGAGELTGWQPVTRFMLNQDTGGAIRGAQRADIYFGAGEAAASMAGYMNRQGKMFFLVLRNSD